MVRCDSKNISVVIQGAYAPEFKSCIDAVRSVFSGAELILSTWEGTDLSGLTFDKAILSPDPGTTCCDKVAGTLNNVSRQLVSTQAGIAAATRPYTLKTRTDILIENAQFLSYFRKYDRAPSPYFKNRLLLCNYYTRNPRVFSTCFHPSDWLLFGRTEDVQKYYAELPLLATDEGGWFESHPKQSTFFTNYICRFTPEQHIFLNFLRKYQTVNCDCYYDRTSELIKQTECAFAECFVVLDYRKQLGITFTKYDPNRYLERYSLVSHWQWKALYQHYCEKRLSPLWGVYLIRGKMLWAMGSIRTGCIRLLDRLGLKKTIKEYLRRVTR